MRKTRALRPFQACVVIAMLPAPLLGQLTLTSHNPPPSVCRDEQNNLKADVIRVETNPGNPFVGRYARFQQLRLRITAVCLCERCARGLWKHSVRQLEGASHRLQGRGVL